VDLNGTVNVVIELDHSSVTGVLDLHGPAGATLVDSGEISGTRDCLIMMLAIADDALVLDGALSADGTTVTGTFAAELSDSRISDSGRSSLTAPS
jgi:hypothetical protein